MKARLENGKIKVYPFVPNKFEADGILVAGGGGNLSDEKLKEYGFLDVIIPTINNKVEELSDIYLSGDVYTYDVLDKTIEGTLSELKDGKIRELKSLIGSKLSQTDWYVIRNADVGTEIPASIKEARADLRDQSDILEAQIKALTTKKSVVLFDINL